MALSRVARRTSGGREANREMAKKLWTKPQLVVLTKGTPEESVLTYCKVAGANRTASGPKTLTTKDNCASSKVENCCYNCQTRTLTGS